MNRNNNKRLEIIIYAGLWLIAIVMFLLDIMRARSYTDLPLLDIASVGRVFLKLLPFMALFAVHNFVLIPRLLKRGLYARYLISALGLTALIWGCQYFQFFSFLHYNGEPVHVGPRHPGPHPLLPLPLFLDVIYDMLIIGVNLAVSLIFQHFDDRLQHESLMKENAENQLTYLKAQINPHFYMNMLNNIHGMIEIDSEKAQEMVIEMSSLMRYMLYDSSRNEIELSSEVGFIKDYLGLMRVRYPEDSVGITAKLPCPEEMAGIRIPPLLFLVFLENAFKHGISYSSGSFVAVEMAVEDGRVLFRCRNTVHHDSVKKRHEGIGLENVKRRLSIIYGDSYDLTIDTAETIYSVTLILPAHETADNDN